MYNHDQIDILNSLLIINIDRIKCYETASEETKEPDLKNLFDFLWKTSYLCKTQLTAEILRLSGLVQGGTNANGQFFRVWLDINASIPGNDRKTILTLCEFGENIVVETYDDALSGNVNELNHEQKVLLLAQRKTLQKNHNKIKNLILYLE
jgi:uncharacterized protein (TIGR02284 family)